MPTVADHLRHGREHLGLSVQEIEQITKIKSEHIRALEEGNYNAFAAPVYIRGFVRNYATVLKLNCVEVMAVLDQELSQTADFSSPPSLTGRKHHPIDLITLQLSRLNWSVVLLLVAVVLFTSLVVWAVPAWKAYRARDPLAGLGPGLYQPAYKYPGDFLPLNPPDSKPSPQKSPLKR